jgi:DNA-binding NarL/FixJ family response regulator
VRLYVLDPHTIYRRRLAAWFERSEVVDGVGQAASAREALEDPGLLLADVVLVDLGMAGAAHFVRAVHDATGARVIVCAGETTPEAVLVAFAAGAAGFLRKDALQAVQHPPAMVRDGATRVGVAALTDREQQVLALIADGHPTREVAARLCYSERTVKNVLHDIVTKLNARSRSQAVAFAVREGLI